MIGARIKILILMTSPLDAIAHALSAVAAIRKSRPLEIVWVVRSEFEGLLKAFDCVDRTIPFERKGGISSAWELLQAIRSEEFDYVFDFEGHARTGLMLFMARSARKIGKAEAREGATIFYKELVSAPKGRELHLVELFLRFGSSLGLDLRQPVAPALSFSDEELPPEWESKGKRVCVFPGRFKRFRVWREMQAFVTALLNARLDTKVYLLGIVPEIWNDEVFRRFEGRLFDLQGKASWGQSLAMIESADLVVAGDNGPAQLAGAMGSPNLTLYGYVLADKRGSFPVGAPQNAALWGKGGDVQEISMSQVLEAALKLL